MRSVIFTIASCLWLSAYAFGQQGTFQTFGSACTTGGQTPAISNRNVPTIGKTYTVLYTGPNSINGAFQQTTQPMLVTGFTPIAIPVPPVFPAQPLGCTIFVMPDIVLPMRPSTTVKNVYESAVDITVPNDVQLVGLSLYHQWIVLHTQCGFAGCDVMWGLVSEGAQAQIGT